MIENLRYPHSKCTFSLYDKDSHTLENIADFLVVFTVQSSDMCIDLMPVIKHDGEKMSGGRTGQIGVPS
jgi:hypothetical protein